MNFKVTNLTERQKVLIGPRDERLFLPLDCQVTSQAQSESGKVAALVLYQCDGKERKSSYYYGVIGTVDKLNTFSFHLQRLELPTLPQEPFVWGIASISDSMVAIFEIGRHSVDSSIITYSEENGSSYFRNLATLSNKNDLQIRCGIMQ